MDRLELLLARGWVVMGDRGVLLMNCLGSVGPCQRIELVVEEVVPDFGRKLRQRQSVMPVLWKPGLGEWAGQSVPKDRYAD